MKGDTGGGGNQALSPVVRTFYRLGRIITTWIWITAVNLHYNPRRRHWCYPFKDEKSKAERH